MSENRRTRRTRLAREARELEPPRFELDAIRAEAERRAIPQLGFTTPTSTPTYGHAASWWSNWTQGPVDDLHGAGASPADRQLALARTVQEQLAEVTAIAPVGPATIDLQGQPLTLESVRDLFARIEAAPPYPSRSRDRDWYVNYLQQAVDQVEDSRARAMVEREGPHRTLGSVRAALESLASRPVAPRPVDWTPGLSALVDAVDHRPEPHDTPELPASLDRVLLYQSSAPVIRTVLQDSVLPRETAGETLGDSARYVGFSISGTFVSEEPAPSDEPIDPGPGAQRGFFDVPGAADAALEYANDHQGSITWVMVETYPLRDRVFGWCAQRLGRTFAVGDAVHIGRSKIRVLVWPVASRAQSDVHAAFWILRHEPVLQPRRRRQTGVARRVAVETWRTLLEAWTNHVQIERLVSIEVENRIAASHARARKGAP